MSILQYDDGDGLFSINALLVFIVVTILLLTLFGINIFFVAGEIFEMLYSIIVPFVIYLLSLVTYYTGWVIYETTDVVKNVSEGGIEIVGGGIEDVGQVLMNVSDYDEHSHDYDHEKKHNDGEHAERIKRKIEPRDHDGEHAERIKRKIDSRDKDKKTKNDLEKFFDRSDKENFSNYSSDNINNIIQNPIQNKKNTLFSNNATYVNVNELNKPITCNSFPNQSLCLN